MKRQTIKTMLIITVFLAGIAACKKSSDLILSPGQLSSDATYLVLDSKGNDTLFLNNPSTPVSISVHAKGATINNIAVYVSSNNSIDKTTWHKIADFPVGTDQTATLSVTPDQIATALGSAIPNGGAYTLYNEVTTTSGATYSLANTNSTFESAPDYHMAMRWDVAAPCSFDQSAFDGQFTIITDTWADYDPGEKVDVQPGPGPNQIQISVYPSDAYGTNRQWVTVDVDPATNAATVAEQYTGDYDGVGPTTMKASVGQVNSCSKTIELDDVTFDQFGGTYKLVIKKL
jgi:hypothetical protein